MTPTSCKEFQINHLQLFGCLLCSLTCNLGLLLIGSSTLKYNQVGVTAALTIKSLLVFWHLDELS